MDDLLSTLRSILSGVDGVGGAVVMGSVGCGQAGPDSDIDILCIIRDLESVDQTQSDIVRLIRADSQLEISLVLDHNDKLVVYLSRPRYVKIDLMFDTEVAGKARYIRGSENSTVLMEKEGNEGLDRDLEETLATKAVAVLPEYKVEFGEERLLWSSLPLSTRHATNSSASWSTLTCSARASTARTSIDVNSTSFSCGTALLSWNRSRWVR